MKDKYKKLWKVIEGEKKHGLEKEVMQDFAIWTGNTAGIIAVLKQWNDLQVKAIRQETDHKDGETI